MSLTRNLVPEHAPEQQPDYGLHPKTHAELAKLGEVREMPTEHLAPETLATGRSTAERMRLAGQMAPTLMPGQVAGLRDPQVEALQENYGKRVQESFVGSIEAIDQDALRTELYELGFSREAQKILNETIQSFADPFSKQGHEQYLLALHKGRPTVNVTRLHKTLDRLRLIQPGTPQQQQYLKKMEGLVKRLIACDPQEAAKWEREVGPTKSGSPLRLAGVFIFGGLALINGLLDIKSREISLPTLLYLGLAAFSLKGGKWAQGAISKEADQLRFLQTKEYESFAKKHGIKGKEWSEAILRLKGKNAKRLLEKHQKGTLTREQMVEALGIQKDSAPGRELLVMAPEDLEIFLNFLKNARSRDAQTVVREYVEHGLGSHTMAELPPSLPA